ncbi:hypothetical protein MYX65_03195 [Acidobacteria bacterium AH-259-L09]|nr:hypothetical protein [Acidobacteria bacterium AH-259-L09]
MGQPQRLVPRASPSKPKEEYAQVDTAKRQIKELEQKLVQLDYERTKLVKQRQELLRKPVTSENDRNLLELETKIADLRKQSNRERDRIIAHKDELPTIQAESQQAESTLEEAHTGAKKLREQIVAINSEIEKHIPVLTDLLLKRKQLLAEFGGATSAVRHAEYVLRLPTGKHFVSEPGLPDGLQEFQHGLFPLRFKDVYAPSHLIP